MARATRKSSNQRLERPGHEQAAARPLRPKVVARRAGEAPYTALMNEPLDYKAAGVDYAQVDPPAQETHRA